MSSECEKSVHSNVILHLLRQSDRFCKNFDRWSQDTKEDRDVICVMMKENAQIESTIVHTLHLLFPGKMQGPFLSDRTMTIEILHVNRSLDLKFLDTMTMPLSEPARKRQRVEEFGNASKAIREIEEISSVLKASLEATNSSLCSLGVMSSGRDDSGVWLSFEVVFVNRINLHFFSLFAINPASVHVKDIRLRFHQNKKQIFLRLYGEGDRRVSTTWEVVPNYTKTGVFACMRKITSAH